jgi:very-short-patch-repair endonuclease
MKDVSNSLEDWETALDLFQKLCRQELGVDVDAEYRFAPPRRWRFDYAIVEQRVAVEVEGGVWTRGRHTRGSGFVKDMEKYNAAAALGWLLIRTTPDNLISPSTLDLIRRAIETRKAG